MMPGLMIEQHTIDIVNMASPILAVLGGLAITALAWFSRRRDIMVVTGSLLLVWWLSINKIYDPNFDIWVLIVVAVLGAPFWLNVAFAMMSMFWYFIAFEGLHYTLTRGAEAAVVWHIQHPLYVALILRLVVFAALLGWLVIKL